MAPEDDEMSVASLTPSVASYMSSWSMPAGAPSRSSTSRGASSNTSGSRRRAGRYGHRVAVADDNCDAASTTFHSRRLRRSLRRPRVRDVEEGGGSSFSNKTKMGRWKQQQQQQRMRGASALTTVVCSGQEGSFQPSLPSWRASPCSALILPQLTTAVSSATSSSTTLDTLGTQIGRIW